MQNARVKLLGWPTCYTRVLSTHRSLPFSLYSFALLFHLFFYILLCTYNFEASIYIRTRECTRVYILERIVVSCVYFKENPSDINKCIIFFFFEENLSHNEKILFFVSYSHGDEVFELQNVSGNLEAT